MTAGRAGIRRRESDGGGGRNSEKNGGIRRKKSPAIPPENKKKPPSFPRKRESILRNKTANSPRFSTKKRRERGNLSVKMDSRVRGNDSGRAGIRRRESDGGGGRNSEKNGGIRRKKPPAIPPEKKKKPPSFPRKRESILRNKTANSPRFSTTAGRRNLSVKMDSRVRGNDGGEAGIRRRESDSGGGRNSGKTA